MAVSECTVEGCGCERMFQLVVIPIGLDVSMSGLSTLSATGWGAAGEVLLRIHAPSLMGRFQSRFAPGG